MYFENQGSKTYNHINVKDNCLVELNFKNKINTQILLCIEIKNIFNINNFYFPILPALNREDSVLRISRLLGKQT